MNAAARPGTRRGRAARIAIDGAATVLALLLAFLLAAAVYVAMLPSVGDAQAKTAAIVRAHHGRFSSLPVPAKLAAAVVSVEDEHFYSNVAVNVLAGAGRAALATLHGNGDPGGSTIAQQLAKLLYGKGSGLGAKLQEVGLGVKLTMRYSRAQVLAMYLNANYYGNGYWGYADAAHGYFGVDPGHLDWAEAGMLAGLLQAPSAYDPLHHYVVGKERQLHVLDQLMANGHLSAAGARRAYAERLPLRKDSQTHLARD